MTDRHRQLSFCPCCFATEENGSWDHTVANLSDGSGYCMNCGNGSCVVLPAWAVDSIREQASWVGKRYYPNDEDRETTVELLALRDAIGRYPGRVAELKPASEDFGLPERWHVTQAMPSGRTTTVMVAPIEGETADDVIKRTASRLPVVLESEP